jgi:hypothetical protein
LHQVVDSLTMLIEAIRKTPLDNRVCTKKS